jgi:hypothetical protein
VHVIRGRVEVNGVALQGGDAVHVIDEVTAVAGLRRSGSAEKGRGPNRAAVRNLIAGAIAAVCLAAGSAQAQADLILTNGKIATMAREGEFVQAVAVKDGKVLATGSNARVLKLKRAPRS